MANSSTNTKINDLENAESDNNNEIRIQPNSSTQNNSFQEVQEEREYVSNELIIKLRPEVTSSEVRNLQDQLNASVIDSTKTLGIQLWEIDGISVEEAISTYNRDPAVKYIEANSIVFATQTFSNDPLFDQLWGLNNTGQTGGTPDADIDAPEAWNIQTGDDIVIGVIDSGVDYTHPDLQNNIWGVAEPRDESLQKR